MHKRHELAAAINEWLALVCREMKLSPAKLAGHKDVGVTPATISRRVKVKERGDPATTVARENPQVLDQELRAAKENASTKFKF